MKKTELKRFQVKVEKLMKDCSRISNEFAASKKGTFKTNPQYALNRAWFSMQVALREVLNTKPE